MGKQILNRRKTGTLLLLLFLALSCFSVWFIHDLEERSLRILIQELEHSTGQPCHLSIGKIRIHFLQRSLTLSDLFFHTGSGEASSDSSSQSGAFYQLRSQKIKIYSPNFLRTLRQKEGLVVDKLEILDPEIVLSMEGRRQLDSTGKPFLHAILPRFIHGLTLGEIAVENGSFTQRRGGADSLFFKIDGIDLHLHTLYFPGGDTLSAEKLFTRITSHVNGVKFRIHDYTVALRGLTVHDTTWNITIDSLWVDPVYNRHVFPKKTGHPAVAEISAEDLTFFNFRWEELWLHHRVLVDSITLSHYQIHSFKDKNIPPTPENKPMFSTLLMRCKLPLAIGKITLRGGELFHEERGEGKEETGRLSLNHLRGVFRNVTNQADSPSSRCETEIRGRIYQSGEFVLRYSFPIDTQSTRYAIQGEICGLSLPEVNVFSAPSANLFLESGTLSRMSFSITGDEFASQAEMEALYHDFKVSLLTPGDGKKRGVLSELANDFILIPDNPKKHAPARKVSLALSRDPRYFQIHHLWSILSHGFSESVGIKMKKGEE